ncbi:MAG: maleylacetoacetate isomerase [Deltaproteobacteria bacterium]|nr:maleylacetoacetate isomerase [Deltaproteobacteria bacterium]
MQLTLYHYWRSSCSWRVRWALALKKIAYTPVAINILSGEHQEVVYRAINPSGQLPTLVIDGRSFSESLAIIDWLDETYPSPPLYPPSPLDKLYVKQLALKIVAGTQPLQNPSLMKYFVPVESERRKHMQHFIFQGLSVYERLLAQRKPGTCSFGDSLTVADICLVPQVYNALRFDVDLKDLPHIRRIYEHCLKTEACDQAAPHRFAPSN